MRKEYHEGEKAEFISKRLEAGENKEMANIAWSLMSGMRENLNKKILEAIRCVKP